MDCTTHDGLSTAPQRTTSQRATSSHRTPARYQPLVVLFAAVAGGICFDRVSPLPVFAWGVLAFSSLIAWNWTWRRAHCRTASVLLLVAAATTAAAWHHCRWHLFATDDVGRFVAEQKQPVCVEAIARHAPRMLPAPADNPMRTIPSGNQSQIDVTLVSLRDGDQWRPVSGNARLFVDGHLSGIDDGDRLRVYAQLSPPRPALNPGQVDYDQYLRAQRIGSRMHTRFANCITVIDRHRGWHPLAMIGRMKTYGNRLLQRYLDHQSRPLAAAVLLGSREQLDREQTQAFLETGTVHLLAISGLHVGILAAGLWYALRRLPISRGQTALLVAGLAVFYMLLTDARPPVVRATVLVLVTCGGSYLGRQRLGFNSLALAALIVLAVNPAELFQVGAQLSFLSVAGLAWFAPQWLGSAGVPQGLKALVAESRPWLVRTVWGVLRTARHLTLVGLTIWLLTLPLVMARFHLFTPAAAVLNTILWIPMTLTLVTGFATLACGAISVPLGICCGTACNTVLGLLETVVQHARSIPGSHYWVPGPPDWWLAGFYGGLAVLAAAPALRPPRRWCLALLAGWIAVGFGVSQWRDTEDRLQCSLLSVGHGCAVIVQLPSGQTVLYDAGQFSSPESGARSIAATLWSKGITHLDAVVLSHGDVDHYNALPGLLDRFTVGVVYVSPVMFENDNAALAALREMIDRAKVPLRELRAGDRLPGGDDCWLEVLHPPRKGVLGGDNANSLVLDISYRARHILLPGDLEPPGLNDVMAEEPLDCDVLLAPHHGSRSSNPTGLAAWCTPEWVVVSGGTDVRIEPIREAYATVGAEVLHTAHCGCVEVTIEGNEVEVDTFRNRRNNKEKGG